MAAILPFLETEQYDFPKQLALPGFSGLGVTGPIAEDVASSNVEMTRLLWTRTLIQQALAGKSFQLFRQGREIRIQLGRRVGGKFEPSPFEKNTIPWARTSKDVKSTGLFSTNSKMRCPTFDLPAGYNTVGGTCPAAGPAQTTSIGRGLSPLDSGFMEAGGPTGFRLKVISGVSSRGPAGEAAAPFNLGSSVCSHCYATGGKYGEPTVQISELVRYSVVQTAMKDPAFRKHLVEAMVWQIQNLPYAKWQEGVISKHDASGGDAGEDEADETAEKTKKEPPGLIRERMHGIVNGERVRDPYPRVIRVHSSGDFYSPEYARFWLEIARRVRQTDPDIVLWAPTRTHVLPKWAEFWQGESIPENFVIRPSAYGLGDYAPVAKNLSGGTSVLKPEDAAATKGVKYNHQCGVYDLAKGNKTCVSALDPDGIPGCRACWVRPDLRINYVAH